MIPKEFRAEYNRDLARLKKNPGGFRIFREPVFESGYHPKNFVDYECAFAAFHIGRENPGKILDVGSYRHFLLGLLAHFPVTTIDVRKRKPISPSETVITGDAKKLNWPNHSFDLVLSMCALEHFGLGRYGDEFDPGADQKAFAEMVRVLRPGGRLIFTTTITRAQPSIAFNAHRIYRHEMMQSFCAGLLCVEEKFYSHKLQDFCSPEEVTADPQGWDVYLGCWEKGGKGKGRKGKG